MEVALGFMILGLMAWLCHTMAVSRGRDPIVWAILGFIFGLVAVIVLALIGTKREKV